MEKVIYKPRYVPMDQKARNEIERRAKNKDASESVENIYMTDNTKITKEKGRENDEKRKYLFKKGIRFDDNQGTKILEKC